MTKYTLTKFIEKLDKLYAENREVYSKAAEALTKLNQEHNNIMASGELSEIGRKNEAERFAAASAKYREEMQTASDNFANGAAEIRKEVDSMFKYRYEVNPEDMDLKTVELIKSGILREAELYSLAMEYKEKGNITMARYSGSFFNPNDTKEEYRHLANYAKSISKRDDLLAFDDYTEVCKKGLRPNEIHLSEKIHELHSQFFDSACNNGQNISIEVDEPWND